MFRFLAKGKRGKVYTQGGVAVKKSGTLRAKKEASWLKILNRHNIGPKLLSSGKTNFSYRFVKGEFLPKWIEAQDSRKKIISVLKDVLLQCRKMDSLGINKMEMHNPYKHIILTKNEKPVMIDFERCYETRKPKNTTQFSQYLTSKKFSLLLRKKGILLDRKRVISLAGKYKKTYLEKDFLILLKLIK